MKRVTIVLFHLVLFLCLVFNSFSKSFFVDPNFVGVFSDGSYSRPWRTVEEVSNASDYFQPGDSIHFKRSSVYSGRLSIRCSGTLDKPIVFTSFGDGRIPIFNNSFRDIITVYNRQYIIIDGFEISDTAQKKIDRTVQAKMSYAIIIDNSPNCTIKNCIISCAGIGIELKEGSNNTLIKDNRFFDLRMVINTEGGDDDFGATPIVISSSNNKVTGNYFEECWAYAFDFGYDGGAVHLFGQNVSENFIAYNTAINCNGFIKTGSVNGGIVKDNIVAYNKVINCGQILTLMNGGKFGANISGMKLLNNVFIETIAKLKQPRFLIWSFENMNVGLLSLNNNIFWLETGIKLINENSEFDPIVHSHNIYRTRDSVGYALNSTETYLVKDTLFRSISSDPQKWDLRLRRSSVAINFGKDVGLRTDCGGNEIIGYPDAGILEYIDPIVSVKSGVIMCHGDSTELIITASNGVGPYKGTGSFRVSAGVHRIVVEDSKANTDTVIYTITEPTQLNFLVKYTPITRHAGSTDLHIHGSGGVPPYLYSLNGDGYVKSTFFTQLRAGQYAVTIMDNNRCYVSKQVEIEKYLPILFSDTLIHDLRLFPNPSTSLFRLNNQNYFSPTLLVDLRVYDSGGNLLYSKIGRLTDEFMFGHDFITGPYWVHILVGTVKKVFTVIKY